MKLRARMNRDTRVVELDDDTGEKPNYAQLKRAVAEKFVIESFELSLNGKHALDADDNTSLSDLDIVSGDLLHILFYASASSIQDLTQASSKEAEPAGSSGEASSRSSGVSSNVVAETAASSSKGVNVDTETPAMDTGIGTAKFEDAECIRDADVNRYLQEPILLCESRVDSLPESLHETYTSASVTNQNEALVVALHVLMMEAGFRSQHREGEKVTSSHQLPSNWHQPGRYDVRYVHPTCVGQTFHVTMVPIATLMAVYGHLENSEPLIKYDLQLCVGDFSNNLHDDLCRVYKDLPRLSRLFKDQLAHPLLQATRNHLGLHTENCLLGLFTELKLTTISYLDAASLCHLGQVCREFGTLCKEASLWRNLYLREFGRRTKNDTSQDWYQLYKQKHVQRAEWRETMRHARMVVPPFLDRPHPPLPFSPVYPPGFIGGDYDRGPVFPGFPGAGGPMPGAGPMFPRPRFDPVGPLPHHRFPPGRGGGMYDNTGLGGGWMGNRQNPGGGGFMGMPRFF